MVAAVDSELIQPLGIRTEPQHAQGRVQRGATVVPRRRPIASESTWCAAHTQRAGTSGQGSIMVWPAAHDGWCFRIALSTPLHPAAASGTATPSRPKKVAAVHAAAGATDLLLARGMTDPMFAGRTAERLARARGEALLRTLGSDKQSE